MPTRAARSAHPFPPGRWCAPPVPGWTTSAPVSIRRWVSFQAPLKGEYWSDDDSKTFELPPMPVRPNLFRRAERYLADAATLSPFGDGEDTGKTE